MQNTNNREGQIRQLVYTMENAVLNMPPGQEQMVWLVDFKGWTLSKAIPVKTVQEIAYVLQIHYPERLYVAILYNPPHIFETFYMVSLINAWYWSNNIKHLLIFFVKAGYVYFYCCHSNTK